MGYNLLVPCSITTSAGQVHLFEFFFAPILEGLPLNACDYQWCCIERMLQAEVTGILGRKIAVRNGDMLEA